MDSRLNELAMKADILVKLAPLFEGHHPPCDNDAQAAARQIVKELTGNVVMTFPKPKDGDTETFPRRDRLMTPEEQWDSHCRNIILTRDEYDALRRDKVRLDRMEAEKLDVRERDGGWWADGPHGRYDGPPEVADANPRAAIDAAIRWLTKDVKWA